MQKILKVFVSVVEIMKYNSGPVLSYKLWYKVGFGLVKMAISTNPKPTTYRNLYNNTGPDCC